MTATFDSSAWIALFRGEDAAKQIQKITASTEIIYTSAVSLLEIRSACERIKMPWEKPIGYIAKRAKIVPADSEICLLAAEKKITHKLHTVDAIIYATSAKTEAVIYTKDRDFENNDGVELIE